MAGRVFFHLGQEEYQEWWAEDLAGYPDDEEADDEDMVERMMDYPGTSGRSACTDD